MSKNIKAILHAKRAATEAHVRQLEKDGAQAVHYTAVISDTKFFVLGVLCDVGWAVHLAAEAVYCAKNGFASVIDWLALVALIGVVAGVLTTVYLNIIHEKEIATRLQKDMSFGLTSFGGLAGAVIALVQMAFYAGVSTPLLLVAAGGILNFATGIIIFLSFKKGVIYGVH